MFDFIAYMRDASERLIEIQHTDEDPRFHRISGIANIEELLSNLVNVDGYQVMVIDTYQGRLIKTDSSLLDNPLFTFYVIKNITTNDFDARETALKQCRVLAKKLLSKLYHDFETDRRSQTDFGLFGFQPGSITYYTIGPFGSNFHGIQVSFNMLEDSDIIYNSEDWGTVS